MLLIVTNDGLLLLLIMKYLCRRRSRDEIVSRQRINFCEKTSMFKKSLRSLCGHRFEASPIQICFFIDDYSVLVENGPVATR